VTEKNPAAEPARRKGRYPKEFRRDAAALVIDQNRTIADVARGLGVVEQTLGNWVRRSASTAASVRAQHRRARGDGQAPPGGECKRLTMERDPLKRGVAFWVKELDR